METLSILLSYGGAGETLFVGAIIGLMTWGWMALRGKNSEAKQEKQDFANLKFLKEEIVNRGGLLVVKKELCDYFKETYNGEIKINEDKCIGIQNDNYQASIVLTGDKYESLFIRFLNLKSGKYVQWVFEYTKSQNEIIKMIDKDIKAQSQHLS